MAGVVPRLTVSISATAHTGFASSTGMATTTSSFGGRSDGSVDDLRRYRLDRHLNTERLDGEFMIGQRPSARHSALIGRLDGVLTAFEVHAAKSAKNR